MKAVMAATLLAAVASLGVTNVVHAADSAAIKELRWGVDGGYPPFDELSPAGTIVGFDPDIATAICEGMKVKCVFVVQPFESAIAALNQNKFDALIASHGVRILSYANQESVYLDLLSGRMDAALQDDIQAQASVLHTPRGKNFQFVGPAVENADSRVAIAVQKGNLKLRDAINKSIANIRANGKYDAVRKKYFAFDIYGS
ncbi:transporter substrate-binding domain-containing protein [Paraburkholderia antibiotica]|uniref:Transporter substrate-binding domain-containing protein n=1 Tax=Paraburkholderia antibiotica TaxID=2728839 RepID=A0A7Y0A0Y0_9BURK|nr:transporter substrate-binding domain-containing protein [Paraburkholderia antibiotica]NML34447.1 transporter substrate-binding domain-containing protein [Paraburkholderia antibiotica]